MSRSPLLLVTVLLSVFVTACGGADGDEPASTAAADGVFPVQVEHRFGTTTVPAEPKRIVVVGYTEQDVVYELGFKPVGVTDWYGDQPNATWPWARAAAGNNRPAVLKLSDAFQFEKIAALRPDLIIGTNAGMKRKDYDRFSKLAPTVASIKGGTDYFSRWDLQTELIAAALGKAEEGKALVDDVQEAYAEVAAEHPGFKGKTITFSQNAFYDGQLYAYPAGLNTEFLTMLGFEINPKLTGLSKPGVQVGVSAERLDVLDADAMVFATEKPADVAALEKVPTFKTLDAIKGNRAVFTDATLSGAMYFMTPLSLRYVLKHLPDQLQAAVDGKAPRKVVETD